MNDTKTIFFIGKPGSGKGTQAKMLAEKTGWTVLAAGAQFRAIAEEASFIGRKTKEELSQGVLMPHWFAMYLYLKSLFSVHEDANVIFDGFSRKEAEAQLIIDSMEWLGRPFVVLNIDVSDEEVEKRLQGRGQTSGRSDDKQDAVQERLEEYETHTTKALALFRSKGNLIDIDGSQTPDGVAEQVRVALGI